MSKRNITRLDFGMPNDVDVITTSTFTVDSRYHRRWINFQLASGITITLPHAYGSGLELTFFFGVSISSGNYIIQRPGTFTADQMSGIAQITKSGGANNNFAAGTGNNTITMNGTTSGGSAGDWVWLVDVASGQWFVQCVLFGSGTLATPFSTT